MFQTAALTPITAATQVRTFRGTGCIQFSAGEFHPALSPGKRPKRNLRHGLF
jgi:hypothetical protein